MTNPNQIGNYKSELVPNVENQNEQADDNQNIVEQAGAEAMEVNGDMDFDGALDYLETKYANQNKTNDGQGDLRLMDNITRARSGDPNAYDEILYFIATKKGDKMTSGDDPEAADRLLGLEKARVAIEVQKQREVDNADVERDQQLKTQAAQADKQAEGDAKDARAEIYTSVYPPSKADFDNEAIKLASRYNVNWQQMTGGVDFNNLAQKESVKATAAFLLIKNAYEHDAPYQLFMQDWQNLMNKAVDTNNRAVSSGNSVESPKESAMAA